MASLPFSSPPEMEYEYAIGDMVEVLCDYENEDEDRVHDWLKGLVVQIDDNLVAVQFPEKVYLTDGWMVPDHVLWYRHDSSKIRQPRKRAH